TYVYQASYLIQPQVAVGHHSDALDHADAIDLPTRQHSKDPAIEQGESAVASQPDLRSATADGGDVSQGQPSAGRVNMHPLTIDHGGPVRRITQPNSPLGIGPGREGRARWQATQAAGSLPFGGLHPVQAMADDGNPKPTF